MSLSRLGTTDGGARTIMPVLPERLSSSSWQLTVLLHCRAVSESADPPAGGSGLGDGAIVVTPGTVWHLKQRAGYYYIAAAALEAWL